MYFLIPDEYEKQIKKAAGRSADEKRIKNNWLKFYRKVKKKVPVVTTHYHMVRNEAGELLADARELERILMDSLSRPDELLTEGDKQHMSELFEDMKTIRPKLDFNFLIGGEDKEIHDTVEGLVRLQAGMLGGKVDSLILQSEVENLIEMIEECMEKQKPDLFELSSFLVMHTEKELAEMPHGKQLERVHELYMQEFAEPIFPILVAMVKDRDKCEDETARAKAEEFLKDMSTI